MNSTLQINQQVILLAPYGGKPFGTSTVVKLTGTRAQLANGCWVTLADLRAYGADRRCGTNKLGSVALPTPELLAAAQAEYDRKQRLIGWQKRNIGFLTISSLCRKATSIDFRTIRCLRLWLHWMKF